MRIAYIVPSFPTPSETFVYREVAGLRELGLDIEVFAQRGPTPAQLETMAPVAREMARETHYIGRRDMARGAFAPPPVRAIGLHRKLAKALPDRNPAARIVRAQAFSAVIAAGRFDRVHAHWPYASQLGAHVHLVLDLPFSISVHAHEVAHDNAHFPAVFEHIDFASFCNRAAMGYLLERLGPGAAARSHLNYHGVDLTTFPALAPPATPPPLRIMSAGRLTSTKGFTRLVEALGDVVTAGIDAELTILGEGPERGAIEAAAAARGLSERVSLPGWVEPQTVVRNLERAHVFALLADVTFHDGLPNVVVEALAVGRPVVLSPLPAATEAIDNGENGFLVSSPEASGELAERLVQIAREPGLAAKMAGQARERASRDFDQRIHLRALKQLFESGGVSTAAPRPEKGSAAHASSSAP